MLLATPNSVTAIEPQLAAALDQTVAVGVGFEVIGCFDESDARFARQRFGHAAAELGVSIDAGAHGRAAGRQFSQRRHRPSGPLDRQLQLPGIAAELLAQADWRGVGQVRAADLDDLVPRLGLVGQHRANRSRAGFNSRSIDTATATWIAVGNMSLVLWPMLT